MWPDVQQEVPRTDNNTRWRLIPDHLRQEAFDRRGKQEDRDGYDILGAGPQACFHVNGKR